MTDTYTPLVRLAARHAYYGGPGPLAWAPLPETARRLGRARAVVRAVGDDLVVAVPTVLSDPADPGSERVFASRPEGGVFRFVLEAGAPAEVAAVTPDAGWRPGATAVVLDNLRADPDGDGAVLGDGPDRWGAPVPIVVGRAVRVPFEALAATPRVRLIDRDREALVDYREPPRSAPHVDVPLDVLPGPGLYTARVGAVALRFWFAPSLRGRSPLAVAEVFVDRPRGASLPASSQVVAGEAPLGRRLRAEVPARETRWRYVVVKSSGAAGAPLGDYAVEPIEPAGPAVTEGDPGVFTSDGPLAWRPTPVFQLARGSPATVVGPLPSPGPGTPLVAAPDALPALTVYV